VTALLTRKKKKKSVSPKFTAIGHFDHQSGSTMSFASPSSPFSLFNYYRYFVRLCHLRRTGNDARLITFRHSNMLAYYDVIFNVFDALINSARRLSARRNNEVLEPRSNRRTRSSSFRNKGEVGHVRFEDVILFRFEDTHSKIPLTPNPAGDRIIG
jgi:hypothetical protein